MAEEKKGRIMPNNLEAEQSVLGCMMIDDEAAARIVAELSVGDFYFEQNRKIFDSMCELVSESNPIDYVTLTDRLDKKGQLGEIGGVDFLIELTNIVPSAANYAHYLNIVKRDSILRTLIKSSQSIIDRSYSSDDADDVLKFAEKSVFDISRSKEKRGLTAIDSSIAEAISRMEKMSIDKEAFKGVRTGFADLDELTNGLQKSDLIILAARPAVGKTTLALNIITNAALKGYKAAVFSLEMPAIQLAQKVLCSIAEVEMNRAKKGDLNPADFEKFFNASKRVIGDKIFIDDNSNTTVGEILSKCRRLKREKGLDIIMIDYLQLMGSTMKNQDNRNLVVGDITRNLKIMAKELDVPILVLSQLSRGIENRTDKTPQMSDLRESGSIEQDADIVMFLSRIENSALEESDSYTDKQYNELTVAKHRNGETGSIFLEFVGKYSMFRSTKFVRKRIEIPSNDQKSKKNVKADASQKSDGDTNGNSEVVSQVEQKSTVEPALPPATNLVPPPESEVAPKVASIGTLAATMENMIQSKPVFNEGEDQSEELEY